MSVFFKVNFSLLESDLGKSRQNGIDLGKFGQEFSYLVKSSYSIIVM